MGPPVELALRNAWKFCGWILWFMVDITASDAADWAYYCPLCSRRIKGQTEFSLAQHIWACHAKSKEAGEMSRRFKAGDLGNLRPARVECGAVPLRAVWNVGHPWGPNAQCGRSCIKKRTDGKSTEKTTLADPENQHVTMTKPKKRGL
jgi:hypothetical protein